jgi:hypothetical protein
MDDTNRPAERIGEFLVRIGAMTEEQVLEVLRLQKETPDTLFGEIAISRGYVDDEAIKRYLDRPKNSV